MWFLANDEDLATLEASDEVLDQKLLDTYGRFLDLLNDYLDSAEAGKPDLAMWSWLETVGSQLSIRIEECAAMRSSGSSTSPIDPGTLKLWIAALKRVPR